MGADLGVSMVLLHEAARRMKKWVDKDRWDAHFSVRDIVFLRITGDQFQPPKGIARSLTRKYEGLFRVKKRVGEVAYELELSSHMRSKHPIFHMSELKKCQLDAHHPDRIEPLRGPTMIVDRLNFVLEKIMDLLTTGLGSNMRQEFFIKWKDALKESSRETEDSLWRCRKEIAKYDEKLR